MRRILNTSFILLAMFLMHACTKKSDTNNTSSIYGNWEWTNTDGGLANQIHETPANTGKQILLSIQSDNTFTITTNGVVTAQGTINITTATCIHDAKTKQVIQFSHGLHQQLMIEQQTVNALVLSDEAHDGLGYTYTKK